MAKVYAIIRGNGDILVGQGGRSGGARRERKGMHLPGGSINRGESALKACLREVREETGIILLEQDLVDQFQLDLDDNEVTFLIFEVASVEDEIANRQRPQITNPRDEPFEQLLSLPFAQCVNNQEFSADYYTDWFGRGLQYAHDNGKL